MSTFLFAIENGVIFDIIFGSFFVIMTVMFGLSLITIYRAHSINLRKTVKKLNVVRYMTSFCIIIQYMTFTGYYLSIPILHELLWNIWIPCFTFAFALLSYNIANIYLDTVNMSTRRQYNKRQKTNSKLSIINNKVATIKKISSSSILPISDDHQHQFELVANGEHIDIDDDDDDDDDDDLYYDSTEDEMDINNNMESKDVTKTSSLRRGLSSMRQLSARSLYFVRKEIKPIFWRFIWCFWVLCSLSNWIGSILGWAFKLYIAQSFCYMLWKLITFIMLCFCQYILMTVKDRLSHCLHKNNKTLSKKNRMNRNLNSGQKRIKNLMFCELMLSIFLLLSCIYEIYIISILMKGDDIKNEEKQKNILLHSTIMSMIIYFPVWTSIHIILLVYPWINRSDIQPSKQKNYKIIHKTNTCDLKIPNQNNNNNINNGINTIHNNKDKEMNEIKKDIDKDIDKKETEKPPKLSHLPSIAEIDALESDDDDDDDENNTIIDITDDDDIISNDDID